MRKVILWNKTEYFIQNDAEENLLQTMELAQAGETGFYLKHVGGKTWINNPKTIAIITEGGFEAPVLVDPNKRLNMPELTDEEREANIAKFTKMREDFAKKQEAKRKKLEADRLKVRKLDAEMIAKGRAKAQAQLQQILEEDKKFRESKKEAENE